MFVTVRFFVTGVAVNITCLSSSLDIVSALDVLSEQKWQSVHLVLTLGKTEFACHTRARIFHVADFLRSDVCVRVGEIL